MSTQNFNYWPLVLEHLRSKISGSNYQAWFRNIEFDTIGNEGRKIIVYAPSEFHKQYIEKKFNIELRESVNKYYPKVIHLEIRIRELEKNGPKKPVQDSLDLKIAQERKQERKNTPAVTEDKEKIASYLPRKNLNNLNPKYTFENLVVTKSNEFTVNLAKGIVQELGTLYNPLFIHSPVGLGKTHLLQAVGHAVLEKNPEINIKYVPSDTFFNQFYLALTKGEAQKFRDFYSSVDLLLVDDIQFIGGKEGFQNEFFHLFNLLHQSNKQIIFTSDRNPKDLIGIEDRLVSRFEWGMVTDIQKPDFDDRMAILKDKLERANLTLSQEHIHLIAEKVNTNIREMEGVINKVRAVLNANVEKELTDRALVSILGQYMKLAAAHAERTELQVANPDRINTAVCRIFGITLDELLGSGRKANIAQARQITCWFYKNDLSLSFPHIGKLLGGRDHTTIMHAVKKIEVLIRQKDTQTIGKVNLIKQFLLEM
jgi:chromosomal replication initiator protein